MPRGIPGSGKRRAPRKQMVSLSVEPLKPRLNIIIEYASAGALLGHMASLRDAANEKGAVVEMTAANMPATITINQDPQS